MGRGRGTLVGKLVLANAQDARHQVEEKLDGQSGRRGCRPAWR